MTEPLSTHPQRRPRKEPPEIIGARESAFVDVEPEPAWRPLLRFTIVTAVCIALFLVLLALGIGWLQSLDLDSSCGFVHGGDRPADCGKTDSSY
jgi:hypothetical protein